MTTMPAQGRYTFGLRLSGGLDRARTRITEALRGEGFGVLTEIDVRATLKARLGVDGPGYLILGACNPVLAHRALEADSSVGALLPCNVVLREEADGIVVEVMDPLSVLGIVSDPVIGTVAHEARARLERAIGSLEAAEGKLP
jgi:uncharacterized protein (DUF302 family)